VFGGLWDALGQRLVSRWIALWTPAFTFWAGGLIVWISHHPDGWAAVERTVRRWPGLIQASAGVVAISLLALSALVMQQATVPVLRLLEGYWPRWLGPVRKRLVDRQLLRLRSAEARFADLRRRYEQDPDSFEIGAELVRLEHELRRYPAVPGRCMPTTLGNILRAAETAPLDKYGLDPARCWTRLWLLLPDTIRQDATQSRAALDVATHTLTWGVLFLVWTPWAWWAPLVTVVAVLVCRLWLLASADRFGQLLEAIFDLHRFALYEAVQWPTPNGTVDERSLGRLLTTYLWTGDDQRA
jgi:hypothetical protein